MIFKYAYSGSKTPRINGNLLVKSRSVIENLTSWPISSSLPGQFSSLSDFVIDTLNALCTRSPI